MPDTQTVSVKEIPTPLWRQVKALAAEQGKSIPACVADLLRKGLETSKKWK